MQHPNEIVGELASYASEIGYTFRVGLGQNNTRYIAIEDVNVTIPCLDQTDVFPVRDSRRVSNVEGYVPKDSVAWVNAEGDFRDYAERVDSSLKVKPLIETNDDDGIDYLDGVTVEGALYAGEDDFGLMEFHETVRSVNAASKEIFRAIRNEYEIDLDEEGGSAEDGVQRTDTRMFN